MKEKPTPNFSEEEKKDRLYKVISAYIKWKGEEVDKKALKEKIEKLYNKEDVNPNPIHR